MSRSALPRLLAMVLALAALLHLVACSSPIPVAGGGNDSIGGNRKLPASAMSDFYHGDSWNTVRDKPYAGYVILRGAIGEDRRVHNLKVVEAVPDGAAVERAIEFAGRIPITGVSVGSNVRPLAEVFVVFYEKDEIRRHALVYAEQTGVVGKVRSEGDVPPTRMLLTVYY